MANLPSEMMDEIFLRLPAKSLARFKSLNQSWYTRIQSCNFVRSHTQQHANTMNSKKAIFYPRLHIDYPMYSYTVSSHAQGGGETMDDVLSSFGDVYEIVGSCDGLLLVLFKNPCKLGIWNPLTNEYRQLLPCKHNRFYDNYGFGCVSSSEKERYNNYKVIQIENTSEILSRVFLYTTRTNSWKIMKSIPYSSCWWQSTILVNSKLHFIFTHKNGHKILEILALDITDEEFVVVPLPDTRDSSYLQNIAELSGNLCLVSCKPVMMKDVWVMKEYGVKDSWTKMFSIRCEGVLSPLCFLDGKILIHNKSYSWDIKLWTHLWIVYEDSTTHTANIPEIDLVLVPYYSIITYNETLISPNAI